MDNMDHFNTMLSDQERKLDEYLECLETGKPFNYRKDYELAESLAFNYLKDGHLYFKVKKYKLAIACFREGTLLDYQNNDLRVALLNNLSEVYAVVEDYRSVHY